MGDGKFWVGNAMGSLGRLRQVPPPLDFKFDRFGPNRIKSVWLIVIQATLETVLIVILYVSAATAAHYIIHSGLLYSAGHFFQILR